MFAAPATKCHLVCHPSALRANCQLISWLRTPAAISILTHPNLTTAFIGTHVTALIWSSFDHVSALICTYQKSLSAHDFLKSANDQITHQIMPAAPIAHQTTCQQPLLIKSRSSLKQVSQSIAHLLRLVGCSLRDVFHPPSSTRTRRDLLGGKACFELQTNAAHTIRRERVRGWEEGDGRMHIR